MDINELLDKLDAVGQADRKRRERPSDPLSRYLRRKTRRLRHEWLPEIMRRAQNSLAACKEWISHLRLLGVAVGGAALLGSVFGSCVSTPPAPLPTEASVAFLLQTELVARVQEVDVWVFDTEGGFVCAAQGRELEAGGDGLRFAALLPLGRYTLVVATDARYAARLAWPDGLPSALCLDELLQNLSAHAAATYPEAQVAVRENVDIDHAPGSTITIQVMPWEEVQSQTEL